MMPQETSFSCMEKNSGRTAAKSPISFQSWRSANMSGRIRRIGHTPFYEAVQSQPPR
uniref:Uncharacterized protein n=1 Tax=Candidatus Kentrum sp. SD TaxID=2126332 RepID=A0A450YZC1_9GAMM|nr:MAG: hypothetical protein BECKSD772F_GA0070984_13371 [Candidatus Kentron sp. SD]VFK47709.1 MAG: hypothetical protein BECKSD772E_GA0070983_110312 [Candidatus Kentron sp. SD]VFK79434.1 MAG: hypothetical protein BECKSD772D_GA0070982_104920 [Candidatus Kentron sp. SD]